MPCIDCRPIAPSNGVRVRRANAGSTRPAIRAAPWPSGGIGRRAGLKIRCPRGRVGSSPTSATQQRRRSALSTGLCPKVLVPHRVPISASLECQRPDLDPQIPGLQPRPSVPESRSPCAPRLSSRGLSSPVVLANFARLSARWILASCSSGARRLQRSLRGGVAFHELLELGWLVVRVLAVTPFVDVFQ
jgi:hypothetical protein